MEEIKCVAKKWGSSIGIIIPNEVVKKEHIKPNEQISVILRKVVLAKDLWGLAPFKKKESAQKIKDWMRKGW